MKRQYIPALFLVISILTGSIYTDNVFAQKTNGRLAASENRPEAIAAQSLFVEDFLYDAGILLSANGWSVHSGAGTNPVFITAPGLTYAGYLSSGIGNAVSLTTSGEDYNKPFPTQTSGTVYAAAMINVTAAQVTGDYFFHLFQNSSTFYGRVYVRKDPATTNYAIGIAKSNGAPTYTTGFTFAPGTTQLVVVKYTFNAGPTNDTVDLFINPVLGNPEPMPTLTAADNTNTDTTGLIAAALRQGSAGNAATVQVDGIRVAKTFADLSSAPRNRSLDFNGDGRSDFGITRNTGGFKTWWIKNNGTAGQTVVQFGLANDNIVPADYDGDGLTDIAVWRSGEPADQGTFYILQSQTSTVKIDVFGLSGDKPTTVGDYDGDGKADVSVYRGGVGTGAQCFFFYRGTFNNPNGNITYLPWGITGDVEAPGDYDGDGRFDVCIRRNVGGQGQFILRRSTDSVVEYVNWGLATDAIVPGDYDGDGRSDFCVARGNPTQGNFYILERDGGGTGAGPIVFGDVDLDFLATGDYDGDGRTDIAVWRDDPDPSQNFFIVLRSSNLTTFLFEWGQLGDEPLSEWNVTQDPN